MSANMLRFLTHKLRTQTLEEQFFEEQSEERDSGTESDDENNADLKQDCVEIMDRSDTLDLADEDTSADSALGGFSLLNSAEDEKGGPNEFVVIKPFCESPSPDSALPSDTHFDQNSSEEELEVINSISGTGNDASSGTNANPRARATSVQYHPEKRKWSQVNCITFPSSSSAVPGGRGGSGGDSSASSDDEVRELMCCSSSLPLQFRSSPPADAHKPMSQSPPAKLFHFAASLDVVSPRKRHRQSHSATPIPRPCLDFEKMQQLRTRAVTAWRPSREVSLIC